MLEVLRRFAFVPALAILGGFVWFTIWIAGVGDREDRSPVVAVTVALAPAISAGSPARTFAGLYTGPPRRPTVDEPRVDETEGDGSGRFVLSAEAGDGRRFFVYVEAESSALLTYCAWRQLPAARIEGARWVDRTGRPLRPVRFTLDADDRC